MRRNPVAIQFQCSDCGKTLSVKDELAGKRVKCPCGAVVTATATAQPRATMKSSRTAQAPRTAAAARPGLGDDSDLGSLFDELTESDFNPQGLGGQRPMVSTEPKSDPLAAYRTDQRGGRTGRSSAASGSRPIGLIILAILNFLVATAAVAGAVLIVVGASFLEEMEESFPLLRTMALIIAGFIAVVGVFYLTLGVGLLSRRPWGWWLAVVIYSFNVCDHVMRVIFGLIGGGGPDLVRAFSGLAIASWIASYIYSEKIRDHFEIKTKPGLAIGIPLGSMAVVALVVHLTSFLLAGEPPAE